MKSSIKKIGLLIILTLAVSFIIFSIEINVKLDENIDKINETLFWSFVKAFIISIGVIIFNSFKTRKT